jgi:hypothetical protein
MKVALITPTPLLKRFATTDYHLVLAHQYVHDEKYRKFYKERVISGDHVMLDNGAYELGQSIPIAKLVEMAEDLNPTAVYLPDARFNTEKTIQLMEEAIPKLKGRGWKLLGVPQGKSLEGVLECYQWILTNPDVDGFGIYEEIGEVTSLGRRWDFLDYLQTEKLVDKSMYYHMLGMEEDLRNIRHLAKYSFASGIDSCKPIAYGLWGIRFDEDLGPLAPYPHRQKGYFNIDETSFGDIVNHNIQCTLKWARNSAI